MEEKQFLYRAIMLFISFVLEKFAWNSALIDGVPEGWSISPTYD